LAQPYRAVDAEAKVGVGNGTPWVCRLDGALEALPPADETQITVAGTLWCRPAAAGSSEGG